MFSNVQELTFLVANCHHILFMKIFYSFSVYNNLGNPSKKNIMQVRMLHPGPLLRHRCRDWGRPPQHQHRVQVREGGLGGGLYCTLLYCTIQYCNVLCLGTGGRDGWRTCHHSSSQGGLTMGVAAMCPAETW